MDDLYLDGVPFSFKFSVRRLRALLAALGIADEVDRLGLKGSKKKKSKKLDEDWMVIVVGGFPYIQALICGHFIANSQAPGSQGGAKSYPSHATNSEPQGPCQVALSNQG